MIKASSAQEFFDTLNGDKSDCAEVVDSNTHAFSEVDRLVGLVDPATRIGTMILRNDIKYGVSGVQDQQDAVVELSEKSEFAERLDAARKNFAKEEVNFYRFIGSDYLVQEGRRNYDSSRSASEIMASFVEFSMSDSDAAPQSNLLRDLVATLGAYSDSKAAQMLGKKIYFTPLGVRSRQDSFPVPRLRFRPGSMTGRLAIPTAAAFVGEVNGVLPQHIVAVGVIGYAAMLSAYFPMLKPTYNEVPYKKVRKTFLGDESGSDAIRALGKLDELLSLARFGDNLVQVGSSMSYPLVNSDASQFELRAVGMQNPILASEDSGVVANDVNIGGSEEGRLTFLTGPNSGGKSTVSKAIVLNQMLGQIGCAVAASEMTMSNADRIFYHIPVAPDLEEQSGRFGHELSQVEKILGESTERSLAVLDDCLDGTTHHERVIILKGILLAARNIVGATVFSTHAHELAQLFSDNEVGTFLQVLFENDQPTYSLGGGISRDSHAALVAADHGLDEASLRVATEDKVGPPVWF